MLLLATKIKLKIASASVVLLDSPEHFGILLLGELLFFSYALVNNFS